MNTTKYENFIKAGDEIIADHIPFDMIDTTARIKEVMGMVQREMENAIKDDEAENWWIQQQSQNQ